MPFYKRIVNPQQVCRFDGEGFLAGHINEVREKADCSKLVNPTTLTSLVDVNCRTFTNILHQLSDLSRHATCIFSEIHVEAASVVHRAARLQLRVDSLQHAAFKLDHKKIKLPVSSLDEESKWTVHYTAPWHQQENVFLPGTRPPCVEDLHKQAKVNLKTVLRECDKLRKDGFRSSQCYSQNPAFSSSSLAESPHSQPESTEREKSTDSLPDEESLVYIRPTTPLIESMSVHEINGHTHWSKAYPLPTPEEKMRQQAQAVATDIVPINITGENFDRQASFRRSMVNTDTVIRRPKKVRRRKTITGVPDNIQRELAPHGQDDGRAHSMYLPGQYSSLGRTSSTSSTLRRSAMRDTSCQTEEVKVVPPSMRRIRAHRGQGISAQMSSVSTSSSGSLSAMSDLNGLVFSPQHNSTDQGFHSLPRSGTRMGSQSEHGSYTSQSYHLTNGSSHSLPHQIELPANEHLLHPASSPKPNAMSSPKFLGYQSEQHVTSSADYTGRFGGSPSLCLNGSALTQPDFDDPPYENIGSHAQSSESASMDRPPSTAESSRCQSTASISTTSNIETDSQCSTLDGRNCSSPTSYTRRESNSSLQSCGTITSEQSAYDNISLPRHERTSSCSSPVNHIYNNVDQSPNKTDTSSLYSVDNEGYYTSMRLDSGLKSHSHSCINKADQVKHNIYECRKHHSQDDRISLGSNKSLTRSISLRKAKKPPRPPARNDSLRRKQRPSHLSESVLNERLISSLQQTLQKRSQSVSLTTQNPCSDFDDPWVLRPRSHSNVSAASSGMSAPAAVCPVTPPPLSDSSSLHSEYMESWDFCSDQQGQRSEKTMSLTVQSSNSSMTEEGLTNRIGHANLANDTLSKDAMASSGMTNGRSQRGHKMTLPLVHVNSVNGQRSKITSPEKLQRLTSPSSGYSSQSNTPTAGTPTTAGLRAKSPGVGKPPKPKVPERSSSLLSSLSVSSSNTSLSSNTSDTFKLPMPPPPPPLPGTTPPPSPSVASLPSSPPAELPQCESPLSPPPTPAELDKDSEEISLPTSPTLAEVSTDPSRYSPGFPSPPPPLEVTLEASLPCSATSLLPPPPPPPPVSVKPTLSDLPVPPPLPSLSGPALLPAFKLKPVRLAPKPMQQLIDGEDNSLVPPSPGHLDETAIWPRPLITAEALQLVQLRSVKTVKNTEVEEVESAMVPVAEDQGQEPNEVPEKAVEEPEEPQTCMTPAPIPLTTCSSPIENGMEVPPSPLREPQPFQKYFIMPDVVEEEVLCNGQPEEVPETPLEDTPVQEPSSTSDDPLSKGDHSSSQASPVLPPKQKPPISPNKPKISQFLPPPPPPPPPAPSCEVECTQVLNVAAPVTDTPDASPLFDITGGQCFTLHQEEVEDSDSESSTPMLPTQRKDSFSSDVSSDCLSTGPGLRDLIIQEQDLGLSDERSSSDEEDQAASSISSSETAESREEEPALGAVANFQPSSPERQVRANGEVHADMVTPARPRTTEDLFAVIHRSKRKVLGRGDCEESRCRGNSLPNTISPPLTPTATSPGGASLAQMSLSLPRQTSSIQRNLRRSSTSSDSFKALLLKKGSRTEGSFRMSAAEMLKCTDPRFQRMQKPDASPSPASSSPTATGPSTPSPPLSSPSQAVMATVENGVGSCCLSPGRSRRAVAEEWARSDGLIPRLACSPTSPTPSSSSSSAVFLAPGKFMRSRTPPSAASSRYNARSRIPSSPMTAISEREGELELGEMSDNYEDQWESRTLAQHLSPFGLTVNPSATMCKGGGT